MTKKPLPSPETLRQLLRYEPETGKLFWKERGPEWFDDCDMDASWAMRAWNARNADKEAFTSDSGTGYRVGSIRGRIYKAHRVIWAMNYGAWPIDDLDHINLKKSDNRIENLRDANASENASNRSLDAKNTSGFKGVSWHKQRLKWYATITCNGKAHSLGLHSTREDAHAAYCEAAKRLHGEFARTE